MNVGVSAPLPHWIQMSSGDLEWQSEHAYYLIHHNQVTSQWHLGRRLRPGTDIKIVGVYAQLSEAQDAAERREASL